MSIALKRLSSFNSLKVRLKVSGHILILDIEFVFQFLKGAIKRMVNSEGEKSAFEVSIP